MRLLATVRAGLVFGVVVLSNAQPSHAQMSVLQTLEMSRPSDVALSPDGSRVAYVVTRASFMEDAYEAALHVVSVRGGSSRTLLVADRIASVQWTADGTALTYLAKMQGIYQAWTVSHDGGPPRQLTHHVNGIAAGLRDAYVAIQKPFRVAPDGKRALFFTRDRIAAEHQLDASWQRHVVYTPEMSASDLSERRRVWLKHPAAAPQLWIADLATGTERLVWTAPVPDAVATGPWFDWSPDGRHIAVIYRDRYTEPWIDRSHLSLLSADSFEARDVLTSLGSTLSPAWSADGRAITFRSEGEIKDERATRYKYEWYQFLLDEGRLALLDAPADLQRRATSKIEKATGATVSQCSVNAVQTRAVCVREDPSTPPDLVTYDLTADGAREGRVLTKLNPGLASVRLGATQPVSWLSKDGDSATSGLILPVGFKPGERYPLVVMQYNLYDKSRFAATPGFTSYAPQVFAGQGYAVLLQNLPENSMIYSPGDFATTRARHLDGVVLSLRSMLDTLVARGVVDPARMGIMGWSWGGFYTTYILTQHPAWFAAGAAGELGSHHPSVYWLGPNRGRTLESDFFGGGPNSKYATRWQSVSPILNVDKLNAPLLLEASTGFLQAIELYQAILEQGKPTELVVYPTDEHVLERSINRYASMQRHIDWFNFWLLDREDQNAEKREQYVRWRELRKLREAQ